MAEMKSRRVSGDTLLFCVRMIFPENRYPARIKSGAGFFGIMR